MARTMTPTTEQPAIALPTGPLLATMLGTSLLTGGLFALASWALGRDEAAAGLAAAAVVAFCTIAGLLAIAPWKRRPLQMWLSAWLGQMLLRLALMAVTTWLLYSATSLAAMPLALAVGVTYLVTVVSEAAVLRRCLSGAAR